MLKIIIIGLISLLCFGCSNATKAKLGLRTCGPNQSAVYHRESLKIPLILTELPKPQVSK